VRTARRLYEQQDMTVAQIGDVLGVSRTTIYRTLAKHAEPVARRRAKPSPTM
jgi:DNA-binding transcriptional regulator LsrR (DeoR family)